jgi:GNAT superfamily N-acetyltransferase
MKMNVRSLRYYDIPQLTKLYNEEMAYDPDFRPLNPNEFEARFIEQPFITEDLIFVCEQNDKLLGCIIADIDQLIELKFGKKIAIIDLILAKKEKFEETLHVLLENLFEKIDKEGAKEIQVHFIADNFKILHDFLISEGFKLDREWYYMESKVKYYELEDLPSGFKWDYIKFKGRHANAKKWLQCHNEAFKDHYGMRPLRYEELKSYTLEENFDPKGYFGIYEINRKRFIAQCSCEIDQKLNEYKNMKRAIIWTVGVIEEYRNRGFGRMLVKKAFNWAYEKGMQTVAIHVDSQNNVAYNLYSSLGFTAIRKRLFYSIAF